MTTEDEALREARKQVGDMYLASHLEKHDMERAAAEVALEHSLQRVADHRATHEQSHADHQVVHQTQSEFHTEIHGKEQLAVSTALEAVARERLIHAEAHEREHIAHGQVHDLAQRAVDKAEAAVEARLHTMNEVRDQLRDQATAFVQREVHDAFVARYERAHDEVLQLVATEREERRANEGKSRGSSTAVGWIIVAIGAASTILGIIIVLTNILTTR